MQAGRSIKTENSAHRKATVVIFHSFPEPQRVGGASMDTQQTDPREPLDAVPSKITIPGRKRQVSE